MESPERDRTAHEPHTDWSLGPHTELVRIRLQAEMHRQRQQRLAEALRQAAANRRALEMFGR